MEGDNRDVSPLSHPPSTNAESGLRSEGLVLPTLGL